MMRILPAFLALAALTVLPAASLAQNAHDEHPYGEDVHEEAFEDAVQDTAPIETPPAPLPTDPNDDGYRNVAMLQGLNKVTARISSIEAPVGASVQFGNLDIVVERCWQAPATERPENAARLEIRERKPGEAPQGVFRGWMFSSSPSLAGLEHPVYDVIVLSCEQKKAEDIE